MRFYWVGIGMQMAKIQNVLIDLDGTLTDPKIGICTSIRYGMEKVGHPLPEDTPLEWCIGPPLKQSLAQLLNTQDDALAERALAMYRERFSAVGLYENELYPQVAQTLAVLQQHGLKLFLATAKPQVYAVRILQHFQLDKYFYKMYGSELTGERTNKGDLIGYILQQEQLNPNETVMIGDREHDILGARRFGIETIAVEYGYGTAKELDEAQPKYRVKHFADILSYIIN